MATPDASGIVLIAPVLAYLLVALVVGAILFKTKVLGDNKWVQVFVSLIVATLFVSTAGTRDYVLTVLPWFAVVVVSLFMILFLMAFVTGKGDGFPNSVKTVALVALGIIFLFSAFFLFSDVIINYIPGSPTFGSGNESGSFFLGWFFSPRVFGAVLLIAASALASWVFVKGSGKS